MIATKKMLQGITFNTGGGWCKQVELYSNHDHAKFERPHSKNVQEKANINLSLE